MRIARIAPLFEAVPPQLYGGTERVVSWLTEELVAQGHDVTLFASGDSVTKTKLEPVWPMAIRLDPTCKDWVAAYHVMMEYVAQRAQEFDVLHFHIDYFPFSLFSRLGVPFLTLPCTVGSTCPSSVNSTSADRRQEESENCTGPVDVRQQADRRCVGWLCRRGDRRLLACWPADGGRRGGDGSGCERVGRRAVCGRRGRAGRPERPLG